MCEKSYIRAAAPIDMMSLHNQVCQGEASSEATSHHKVESPQQSLLGKPLFRNPEREG